MLAWPPESSSGERTWAEAICSRWSQSRVQLRRGAIVELSQYLVRVGLGVGLGLGLTLGLGLGF